MGTLFGRHFYDFLVIVPGGSTLLTMWSWTDMRPSSLFVGLLLFILARHPLRLCHYRIL
jgi:hypothetical protein